MRSRRNFRAFAAKTPVALRLLIVGRMTIRTRITVRTMGAVGVASLLAVAACGSMGGSRAAAGESTGTAGSFGSGSATGVGTGAGGSATVPAGTGAAGTGADDLPPEREVESSYKAPVATGHFVWIANPTSGRVAYVDAASLAVKTIEAGNAPTYMTAVPGSADAVIVLNTLSNDATFLRANGTALESRTFPGLAAGSNGWAVSPDGHWAIAWTNATLVPAAPPTQGFHDVTIVDLRAAATVTGTKTLAVGYRPASLTFAADGSRAFVVTQDGVSVISPADGAVVDTVPLGAHGATDPEDTHDVSITPDGRLAVVRRDGSASVAIVELGSHARTEIALSGVVTDVDVSPDGARAVAVVRSTGEVAVLPLAGHAPAAADVVHVSVTNETIGQVALTASGTVAVLYSNALASERITVLSLGATPAFHSVRLHVPVLSALPTADGKFAVVLHPDAAAVPVGGGADGGTFDGGASPGDAGAAPAVVAATAFSLVPLDGSQPPRIEATDAPIQTVAVAPTSNRVLVTVRDDKKSVFGAYLGLMPSLEVQRYPLASPPTAAGVVAGANRGYVAQQYADGRISFLSLDGGDARTLTGYELGARVVQWSAQ
jgi:hypothetical protein